MYFRDRPTIRQNRTVIAFHLEPIGKLRSSTAKKRLLDNSDYRDKAGAVHVFDDHVVMNFGPTRHSLSSGTLQFDLAAMERVQVMQRYAAPVARWKVWRKGERLQPEAKEIFAYEVPAA